MLKKTNISLIIIVFIALILGINSMFIVEEGYQAITIRLGRIEKTYTDAGINFKFPLIDQVTTYPKKTLSWNNNPEDIVTNDKEYLRVNVTARWRISDPEKFYKSNKTIQGSYAKLDNTLDPEIKSVIAAHNRVEVVRTNNDMLEDGYETSESAPVETGRLEISQKIKEGVQEYFAGLGIEIIDIIFKKVRFSDTLTASVYDSMIKSRKVIAEGYRSEGEGAKQEIIGTTDKEILKIESEAKAYAQEIMGDADAKAAKIYAEAYDVDPEFYSFWRALESYKETLPKFNKTFSTDMEYFQYLYSSK